MILKHRNYEISDLEVPIVCTTRRLSAPSFKPINQQQKQQQQQQQQQQILYILLPFQKKN